MHISAYLGKKEIWNYKSEISEIGNLYRMGTSRVERMGNGKGVGVRVEGPFFEYRFCSGHFYTHGSVSLSQKPNN